MPAKGSGNGRRAVANPKGANKYRNEGYRVSVSLRFTPALLARLDYVVSLRKIDRSEAVRRILDEMLPSEGDIAYGGKRPASLS